MGWKSVKDHYRIGHHVQVTEQGICIGSSYIHDIIVIGPDGTVSKRYRDGYSANQDLARYQAEMDADPEKLKDLVLTEDRFEKSIVVYTYRGGEIIEKLCEEPGWPNVTHDGDMMYENTFSTDKAQVVLWAKADARAAIRSYSRLVAEKRRALAEVDGLRVAAISDLKELKANYPRG